MLDSLGDGGSGSNGESLGLTLGVSPAENLGNGLQSKLLELGLGDQNNGSGAVVQGSSVGGGDGAVRLEGRAHSLELGLVEVLDLVIPVNDNGRLASATADLNGDNLLEETGFSGSLSPLVGVDGIFILSLTAEVVLVGAELGLETHVLVLEGIGQTVLEDTVDEGLVAVLGTGAEVGQVVGGVGHGFGTGSDDDVVDTEHDVLGTEDDGLQRRGAHLVDGGGDDVLAKASTDSGLAGGSLTQAIRGL